MNQQNTESSPGHDPFAFAVGGGEMGELTRCFDWSLTPLGPISQWPQSLKIAVRIMLDSRYAMWLGWGPDFTFFYNDAYAKMTLGPKHPWALGKSTREVWPEIWDDVGPRAEKVIATGEATWDEGLLLFLERRGFPEETYHTFSYSPLPGDQGGIGGMLCVVTEDTERTIGERRLRTLRELAARTNAEARSAEDACLTAARTLEENARDLSFVLIYLLDDEGRIARRVGITGLPDGSIAAPSSIDLANAVVDGSGWPLNAVLESDKSLEITDLQSRFGQLPGGPWPESPKQALIVPMAKPGQTQPSGFVVAGLSPRLVLTEEYKGFVELLAGHVATAVANARAYEEERHRAEALAEIDRAKTAFFSNVSHEFRTPLTLMLGPVEDLLSRSHTDLPPAASSQLEVVNRNGLRLLRLVNTLLDFSRIEAGRVRAVFQPTDLATFTAELASNFRSACDRAGLQLTVNCQPLNEPAYVDRDMWEKIVLNLISNAFKFTYEGEIEVVVRRTGSLAELRVRDTGTGVPADEMPRLFERFHRIENARGRTHEGSGIGLALVQELVKLHGGSVTAESVVDKGTVFIVTIPLGRNHLPYDQIGDASTVSTGAGATPFVEEALRWLPDEDASADEHDLKSARYQESLSRPHPGSAMEEDDDRPSVLIADDNADMREYIARLLSEQFRVQVVPDGEAALTVVRHRAPDLILTDVMMPKLGGFGLLQELRADPQTSALPVIMLSARAGEESRVEGMDAGADDYLVKPFSARELLARVSAHLQMARMRRKATQTIRESEERLRVTLASIGDAVITTDTDGHVDYLNGVAESLTGWTNADAFGQPLEVVFNIIGEATRTTVESPVVRALREGVVVGLANHTLLIRKDGVELPIDDSAAPVRNSEGGIVGCVLVFRDVSERRLREKQTIEQAEASRKLAAIVDSSDDAIISKTLNGMIQSWNGAAEAIFGYAADEALGRPITMLFPPDRLEEEDRIIRRIRSGERIKHFDTVRMAKDGTAIPVSLTISPIKDEEGEIVGVSKIVRDITERKHLEDELRQVAAELSDANRQKDEFLATLAHELRNPLAPLRNGLELIQLSGNQDTTIEQARTMMERQLTHLIRLVDDLMDLSRITRGKIELRKEPIALSTVVNSAVETSRLLIENMGHELIVKLPDQPIVLDADPTRLAQIFMNLLTNAAKYSDRGARITLSAERQGNEVLVSVKDTGIGIPANMLDRIFDMFSQVDRSLEKAQGGLGIGLTLVKRLVEMHGGNIKVKSEGQGKGSEFIVRLPILMETSVSKPLPDKAAESNVSLRILIVDDNRDGADSLAMMLQIMGNETATAYDGQEGVTVAERLRPDVVLLDIGLPKLNGFEAARHIREQTWGEKTVLIAVTGWGQEEDRRRSREAGFDYHMVKPVDPNALMKLFAELRNG